MKIKAKKIPSIAYSRGHRDKLVKLLTRIASGKYKLIGAKKGLYTRDFSIFVIERKKNEKSTITE